MDGKVCAKCGIATKYFAVNLTELCVKCYNKQPHRMAVDRERALKYYRANKPKYREANKAKRLETKVECYDKYGVSCTCCGESRIEFLTIDHINGGGTKHRREEKIGNIYFWLKRNNFPSGFRTLCFNCNCALGHSGYCPHEVQRQEEKMQSFVGVD